MTRSDLMRWLDAFPTLQVVVIGDFFLDKYLVIDPALAEPSIETGIDTFQVVSRRTSPGAAGTIASNLAALGLRTIHALTIIGKDGEGFDLRAGLESRGIPTRYVIEDADRVTPTYVKPMRLGADGSQTELNRQDIKNREPTPRNLERAVIAHLEQLAPEVHGVVVMDQVTEPNCGVVTDAVRARLSDVARDHPNTYFIGDARGRIRDYRNIIVKPNAAEVADAVAPEFVGRPDRAAVETFGARLSAITNQPVYVTLGADGILVYDGRAWSQARTIEIDDPIDVVGAGDSVTAAIISALCSGASLRDAAILGNIVASITVQQLATTGTASPQAIIDRFGVFEAQGLT